MGPPLLLSAHSSELLLSPLLQSLGPQGLGLCSPMAEPSLPHQGASCIGLRCHLLKLGPPSVSTSGDCPRCGLHFCPCCASRPHCCPAGGVLHLSATPSCSRLPFPGCLMPLCQKPPLTPSLADAPVLRQQYPLCSALQLLLVLTALQPEPPPLLLPAGPPALSLGPAHCPLVPQASCPGRPEQHVWP